MDDQQIVEYYFARDEQALTHTAQKYGALCHSVAANILASREDAEECVNDTYLKAWNSIPPERPALLGAYLCRIARNLAINRYRAEHRDKRGGGQTAMALDELSECVASSGDVAREVETLEVAAAVQRFLNTLPDTERRIFVRRYWHMESVADLAERFGCGQSRINSMLHRTRGKLQKHLREEGLV